MKNYGNETTWTPDREDVELIKELTMLGCPDHRIAAHFGISKRRLLEVFNFDLQQFSDNANKEVMMKLYERCMQGDIKAITFWMERRAGWTTQNADSSVAASRKPEQKRNSLPISVIVRDDSGEEQRITLADYAKRQLVAINPDA